MVCSNGRYVCVCKILVYDDNGRLRGTVEVYV